MRTSRSRPRPRPAPARRETGFRADRSPASPLASGGPEPKNFARSRRYGLDPAPGRGDRPGPAQESVDHSVTANHAHLYARFGEPSRVVEPVVTQHVGF